MSYSKVKAIDSDSKTLDRELIVFIISTIAFSFMFSIAIVFLFDGNSAGQFAVGSYALFISTLIVGTAVYHWNNQPIAHPNGIPFYRKIIYWSSYVDWQECGCTYLTMPISSPQNVEVQDEEEFWVKYDNNAQWHYKRYLSQHCRCTYCGKEFERTGTYENLKSVRLTTTVGVRQWKEDGELDEIEGCTKIFDATDCKQDKQQNQQ